MPVSAQYPLPGSSRAPRQADFVSAAPSRVYGQEYQVSNTVRQFRIVQTGERRRISTGQQRNLLA